MTTPLGAKVAYSYAMDGILLTGAPEPAFKRSEQFFFAGKKGESLSPRVRSRITLEFPRRPAISSAALATSMSICSSLRRSS